jgi:hypothetical protein
VWLFTDNTTVEAAYFRGSSKSRQLHGLVLRLRLLEMRLGIIIRVIHVSGKRIIQVSVDGVSRGDLNAGVMAGANTLSFVPLHLSAVDRSEETYFLVVELDRGQHGCVGGIGLALALTLIAGPTYGLLLPLLQVRHWSGSGSPSTSGQPQ